MFLLPLLSILYGPAEEPPPRLIEALALYGDWGRDDALWPGFEPDSVPVLAFDGTDSWLWRHPRPPEGFASVSGHPGLLRWPGRHPEVRANTSISLAGSDCAVFDMQGERGARELAALALHEAFHAYQNAHQPLWQANELDLLTLPFDDAEALAARRVEGELLRLALAAPEGSTERAELARLAAHERAARAAAFEPWVVYERGIELREGLAQYVQYRALADRGVRMRSGGFPAEELRQGAYATGEAWALLLDAFAPAWKSDYAGGSARPLDELLRAALEEAHPEPTLVQAALVLDLAAIRSQAVLDAGRVRQRRERALADFLQAPGWSLEVEVSTPLMPAAFDPLNVEALGAGRVLHRRWLKLTGERAEIEVLDLACLTTSAGAHPLFEGVQTLLVTGLAEEPKPTRDAGQVAWQGASITLSFDSATLERDEGLRRLRVRAR
jgi:hypothetical protein